MTVCGLCKKIRHRAFHRQHIEVYNGLSSPKDGEYTIRDYNNALTLTVQTDEHNRPKKEYRGILKKLNKLIR